jgi:type II secretory pathway pseudopilin PulG
MERGLTMIIALVVVAVLLFVAVVLLSNAFGSVATENTIRAKIAAFDAAEAGINEVVDVLDKTHGNSTDCVVNGMGHTSGTLADGGSYTWCIQYNGILNGHGTPKDHEYPEAQMNVPDKTVYAWSSGKAQDGGRGVLIEALIAPSTGLVLPTGVVDAAGDVYGRGDVGLYESSVSASDANVRANGNIYAAVPPHIVQGNTYAVGVDQMDGINGTNSHSTSISYPSQNQVDAAAQNARNEATSAAPVISPPTSSSTLTGSVMIQGDLDLQNGTVLFQRGLAVFIDGNLCIHGQARVINDGATIWVSGVVSTAGTGGGYAVASGSSGTLIALGGDDGKPCSNSVGKYAVALDSSTTQRLGLVYAPHGSIDLRGTGTLVGAIDAGDNIYLDSTQGGGLQYDPTALIPIPTYDFKVVSYMEY